MWVAPVPPFPHPAHPQDGQRAAAVQHHHCAGRPGTALPKPAGAVHRRVAARPGGPQGAVLRKQLPTAVHLFLSTSSAQRHEHVPAGGPCTPHPHNSWHCALRCIRSPPASADGSTAHRPLHPAEFMYRALDDGDLSVRKNAVMVLTHLILNDMMKVGGMGLPALLGVQASWQRLLLLMAGGSTGRARPAMHASDAQAYACFMFQVPLFKAPRLLGPLPSARRSRATLPRWRCGWRTTTRASPRWPSSSSTSWPRRSTRWAVGQHGQPGWHGQPRQHGLSGATQKQNRRMTRAQGYPNGRPGSLPAVACLPAVPPCSPPINAWLPCPPAPRRAPAPSTTCCPTSCPTCPRSAAWARPSSSPSCST